MAYSVTMIFIETPTFTRLISELLDYQQILMLVAYPKNVKDNLTDKETAILRTLVKEL